MRIRIRTATLPFTVICHPNGKRYRHGLNNYKDTKPKCRLYWCLIEFIDWRYSQSCWYFRPALWTIAPLTFSLVSSPPPPPSLRVITICRKVPLEVNFLDNYISHCIQSNLSKGLNHASENSSRNLEGHNFFFLEAVLTLYKACSVQYVKAISNYKWFLYREAHNNLQQQSCSFQGYYFI